TEHVQLKGGPPRVSDPFLAKFDCPTEDTLRQVEQSMIDISAGVPGLIALTHLQTFTIAGPYTVAGISETPSRRKIFTCIPASADKEQACADKIVATLARQAFRRPLTDADTEYLMNYYGEGRKQGTFESGIEMAVQAVIS